MRSEGQLATENSGLSQLDADSTVAVRQTRTRNFIIMAVSTLDLNTEKDRLLEKCFISSLKSISSF